MAYQKKLELIQGVINVWLKVALANNLAIKVQSTPDGQDWLQFHINTPLTRTCSIRLCLLGVECSSGHITCIISSNPKPSVL